MAQLQKPEQDEWRNGSSAMAFALQLEKNLNQGLLDLHKIASRHVDPHVSNKGALLCLGGTPSFDFPRQKLPPPRTLHLCFKGNQPEF